MVLNIIFILGILFSSMSLEKAYKIPTALSIMLISIVIKFIFPSFLAFTTLDVFSEEMLSFVVLLVLVDAFIISFKDLKENWLSLVYLAGIAIIMSIATGAILSNTLFNQYDLGLGAIIALFAMVLATDPVAVVGTMKQYPKLPHKVKFLAEGESLFNDAVALMSFMAFGIYLMQGNEITAGYVVSVSIKMILGSVLIGGIVGLIGLLLMKRVSDTASELVLVLLIAYISFEVAELYHLSGLLSEIVAIITMTTIIKSSYEKNLREQELITGRITQRNSIIRTNKAKRLLSKLFVDITNTKSQEDVLSVLNVLAMFINAVLFTSLAVIMDFSNMLVFWKEILMMFVVTTLIRVVMMGKFAFFSNKSERMSDIDLKSYSVLVFAGIKGGLSIVMLTMLNKLVPDFEHFAMYTAIVSGVILLSLIINVIGLSLTIKLNQKAFEKEYEKEKELGH